MLLEGERIGPLTRQMPFSNPTAGEGDV